MANPLDVLKLGKGSLSAVDDLIKLLRGKKKVPTTFAKADEGGWIKPADIGATPPMKDKQSLLNAITGIGGKGKQVRADVPGAQLWASERANLSPLLRYNPLVSTSKGRITLPRVGAAGLGLYGGANLLSANSPAASGLTQEQIDALNAANLAGVLPSMKAQFMPDESYYTDLQDYINTISAGNAIDGNYSGGGGATGGGVAGGLTAAATGAEQRLSGGAGTGLAGMTPVSGTAATMPSALRETGKISDAYATKVAKAKSTAGASNKLANAYNQTLAARMNMGLQLSKMEDKRTAQKDWRDYLTANPNLTNPASLGQYATTFTGDEPGLAEVQKQWSALGPDDLKKLAGRNIFSPADLYIELMKNNPSQYGG